MVYIFRSLFVLRKCGLTLVTITKESDFDPILTADLLKLAYRYNKIRKAFSNSNERRSVLYVKYNIC